MFLSIFSFLIILSILVFIHEMGHYLVARHYNVPVHEFSIGMGPVIWERKDETGTVWKICWLPIGGYVTLHCQDDRMYIHRSLRDVLALRFPNVEDAFCYHSLKARFLVVLCGPLANYLLAAVIFTCFFMVNGKLEQGNEISSVEAGSPAYEAGLKVGDRILSVDGKDISGFDAVRNLTVISTGAPMQFEVLRGNSKRYKFSVTPGSRTVKDMFGREQHVYFLGIGNNELALRKLPFIDAVSAGVKKCYDLSALTLKFLWQVVTLQRDFKQVLNDMGGPVKISAYSGKFAEQGLASALLFMAVISVNLGLVNLLPIPGLDGGFLLAYSFEILLGKYGNPISYAIIGSGRTFFFFLIIFMLYMTYNDIVWLLGY